MPTGGHYLKDPYVDERYITNMINNILDMYVKTNGNMSACMTMKIEIYRSLLHLVSNLCDGDSNHGR